MADCEGKSRGGKPCRYTARFPANEPRFCGNCDPSPEAVERRRRAGAIRKRSFSAAGEPSDDPHVVKPQEPTIDYIVDLALSTADRVSAGTLTGEQGRAMKLLYQVALEGMKARGTVGDARAVGKDSKPPPKSSPSDDNPTPTPGAGSLEELDRQLDA